MQISSPIGWWIELIGGAGITTGFLLLMITFVAGMSRERRLHLFIYYNLLIAVAVLSIALYTILFGSRSDVPIGSTFLWGMVPIVIALAVAEELRRAE